MKHKKKLKAVPFDASKHLFFDEKPKKQNPPMKERIKTIHLAKEVVIFLDYMESQLERAAINGMHLTYDDWQKLKYQVIRFGEETGTLKKGLRSNI